MIDPEAGDASASVRSDSASTLLDLLVFLTELLLLAVLAVAGARLGDGIVASILLAVGLPVAAAVLWGLLLAPRAAHRLRHPGRLMVKVALVAIAATLLGVTDAVAWAIIFGAFAASVLALGELTTNRETREDIE
jgi:hypothetical protein